MAKDIDIFSEPTTKLCCRNVNFNIKSKYRKNIYKADLLKISILVSLIITSFKEKRITSCFQAAGQLIILTRFKKSTVLKYIKSVLLISPIKQSYSLFMNYTANCSSRKLNCDMRCVTMRLIHIYII